MTKVHLVNR